MLTRNSAALPVPIEPEYVPAMHAAHTEDPAKRDRDQVTPYSLLFKGYINSYETAVSCNGSTRNMVQLSLNLKPL